ncbi:hypothetical protein SAMN04488511_107113 [Pedobacter suwonensis]|uniref:Uncharacterized protein n=1 Tax=Pedobacter suwonensis TaxID=332999 RepID=A0A1I0T9G6_9SPHI|nr:hypothetical protein SAMN04488511_107113 [Pedobacter suwonensis]
MAVSLLLKLTDIGYHSEKPTKKLEFLGLDIPAGGLLPVKSLINRPINLSL